MLPKIASEEKGGRKTSSLRVLGSLGGVVGSTHPARLSLPGGNVIPHWLQASEAVLHNGCTTAVEGIFLDRPVIAFRPEKSLGQTELPNHISIQVSSEEDLIALLEKVTEEDSKVVKNELNMHGSSSLLEMVLSSERMIGNIA